LAGFQASQIRSRQQVRHRGHLGEKRASCQGVRCRCSCSPGGIARRPGAGGEGQHGLSASGERVENRHRITFASGRVMFPARGRARLRGARPRSRLVLLPSRRGAALVARRQPGASRLAISASPDLPGRAARRQQRRDRVGDLLTRWPRGRLGEVNPGKPRTGDGCPVPRCFRETVDHPSAAAKTWTRRRRRGRAGSHTQVLLSGRREGCSRPADSVSLS